MTPLRVIDTGLRDARWNIAMTAALTQRHADGQTQDTLRLHRYPRSVLLGRHQPSSSVDVEYCHAHEIAVARRVSGGGAVYMNPDVLAFDLVVARTCFASLDHASRAVGEAMVDTLRAVDVIAAFVPPNAVTIGGRKVSGSSGGFEGGTLALQGTIVFKYDPNEARAALKCGDLALAEISQFSDLPMSVFSQSFAARVAESLGRESLGRESLGRKILPAELSGDEQSLAAAMLQDEIGQDDFVFDRPETLLRSA